VNDLTFEATVTRIARLAKEHGGTISAEDVEGDDALARNRSVTSAAGHMLAGDTHVVSRPAEAAGLWFPYAELTFSDPAR
jgi:hypothetical protein